MIKNFDKIKHKMSIEDLIKSKDIIERDLDEKLENLGWRQHRMVCEIELELAKRKNQ